MKIAVTALALLLSPGAFAGSVTCTAQVVKNDFHKIEDDSVTIQERGSAKLVLPSRNIEVFVGITRGNADMEIHRDGKILGSVFGSADNLAGSINLEKEESVMVSCLGAPPPPPAPPTK
ncbi:MAG TPA: hypothetical protein VM432_03955 [Bdellovibrionales bacterium]|nr:hypothetical protein [Bdellovibrionales bacterium]